MLGEMILITLNLKKIYAAFIKERASQQAINNYKSACYRPAEFDYLIIQLT